MKVDSFDARDWARAFTDTVVLGDIPVSESLLTSWFANALLRGYDEGKSRAAADGLRLSHPEPMLPLHEVKGRHIDNVLTLCEGNITRACQQLEIGRTTMHRYLKGRSRKKLDHLKKVAAEAEQELARE